MKDRVFWGRDRKKEAQEKQEEQARLDQLRAKMHAAGFEGNEAIFAEAIKEFESLVYDARKTARNALLEGAEEAFLAGRPENLRTAVFDPDRKLMPSYGHYRFHHWETAPEYFYRFLKRKPNAKDLLILLCEGASQRQDFLDRVLLESIKDSSDQKEKMALLLIEVGAKASGRALYQAIKNGFSSEAISVLSKTGVTMEDAISAASADKQDGCFISNLNTLMLKQQIAELTQKLERQQQAQPGPQSKPNSGGVPSNPK